MKLALKRGGAGGPHTAKHRVKGSRDRERKASNSLKTVAPLPGGFRGKPALKGSLSHLKASLSPSMSAHHSSSDNNVNKDYENSIVLRPISPGLVSVAPYNNIINEQATSPMFSQRKKSQQRSFSNKSNDVLRQSSSYGGALQDNNNGINSQ